MLLIITFICLLIHLYIKKNYFRKQNIKNTVVTKKNIEVLSTVEKKFVLDKINNTEKFGETKFSSGKKIMVKDIDSNITKRLYQYVKQHLPNEPNILLGEAFFRLYTDNDFISWHYDGNYTENKKYTFVFLIDKNDCNTSVFEYKDNKTGEVESLDMEINSMIYYEGDKLYHRITSQTKGCYRMVLVCPVNTGSDISLSGYFEKILLYVTNKFNIHI